MAKAKRDPIFLPPGGGRAYPMGRISSVFKADGVETESRYSISEWWLDPNTKGPGSPAGAAERVRGAYIANNHEPIAKATQIRHPWIGTMQVETLAEAR